MSEERTAEERLLWIVLGCLAWSYAAGGLKDGLYSTLLVILTFALGLGAILLALARRLPAWCSDRLPFALFTFLFVEFAVMDAVARSHTPYLFTTDAHAYMDYAARLLLHGRNPYNVSLYGAIVAERVPIELQTPLVDGGLTDRVAYPSLSFLYVVPFVKLGIDTRYAYAGALYATFALMYWAAPRRLRPLVLLPFFLDHSYLSFSFGGVTDSVWALCLCLVVVYWKRPSLAALFFGLACSYKQHPWLLAPFLLVRILVEHATESRRARFMAAARFSLIAAGTFVVINAPFYLWKPSVWMHGVLEPLATKMVPMGEGVSALLPFVGLAIPQVMFTIAFWGAMVLLLLVCSRWQGGRYLVWIAPSIAFFFNYRSLSTYWYFNLLPLAFELVRNPPRFTAEPSVQRWRPFAITGSFIGVLFAMTAVVLAKRADHELTIEVKLPIRTWDFFAHRVDIRVTNSGSRSIEPRFWMQGIGFQPLPWHIDEGPLLIAPGATADYSVSALQRVTEFDVSRSARLTVTDARSDLRKIITIEPEEAAQSLFAVPNPRYRFWDVQKAAPTYWELTQRGSVGARTRPLMTGAHRGLTLDLSRDPKHAEEDTLRFCNAVASCWASSNWSRIRPEDFNAPSQYAAVTSSDFGGRREPLTIWAQPPKGANVAPDYALRYGVRLWFDEQSVLVLLGGEVATSGVFDEGAPFEVVPGTPGEWARYKIDIPALQAKYAPLAYPKSKQTPQRFLLIDVPMMRTRLGLVLSSRSLDPVSASFGEIEDPIRGRDAVTEVVRDLDRHPAQVDLWRSDYELELRNAARAWDYAERAMQEEPHPDVLLRGAEVARNLGRLDAAKSAYLRVSAQRPIDASLGLGWTAIAEKQPAEARGYFERALDLIETDHSPDFGRRELIRRNGLVGAALAFALLGDCPHAMELTERLPQEERDLRTQEIPELKACSDH